jgi:hypothetical protein
MIRAAHPLPRLTRRLLRVVLPMILLASPVLSDERTAKSGVVYVPVYSHIYFGDQLRPFNLAVTVSLRNTSATTPLRIEKADYYDTAGKFVRNLLPKSITLRPLETHNLKIQESDLSGGSGANVLVSWTSGTVLPLPIVESVMIGTAHGQGISFVSRGAHTKLGP